MGERSVATRVTLAGPAKTIGDVVKRMESIAASLPESDGVRHFNRLYLAVTRAVEEGVRGVSFQDEPFISQLDVVFANLYFEALEDWEAHAECSPAWRPLLAAREHTLCRPIQFALAGMNAHINHDLAVAVEQTLAERHLKPTMDSPQYRDFTAVNAVLRKVEKKVKRSFLGGFVTDVDRATGDEADELAMWSIADARAQAWHHARILWRLRNHREASNAYLAALSEHVKLEGEALLLL